MLSGNAAAAPEVTRELKNEEACKKEEAGPIKTEDDAAATGETGSKKADAAEGAGHSTVESAGVLWKVYSIVCAMNL